MNQPPPTASNQPPPIGSPHEEPVDALVGRPHHQLRKDHGPLGVDRRVGDPVFLLRGGEEGGSGGGGEAVAEGGQNMVMQEGGVRVCVN